MKIIFARQKAEMESLRRQIATEFGVGHQPDSNNVVRWDGFDQLEKESAVQFYTGKTWAAVLEHLRGLKDQRVFRAAYYLEEWSVLSQEALPYYLRAHLEFLLDTLSSPRPDEEFIYFLVGQLYQVIHMHKGSPFNQPQTTLLQRVARTIAKAAHDQKRFPYFHRDIQDQVALFLVELHAHANTGNPHKASRVNRTP